MVLIALSCVACGTESPSQEAKAPSGPQESSLIVEDVPVPAGIQSQLLPPEDLGGGTRLRARLLPTGEGPPRLLITGEGAFCSPTGNCDHWIFRESSTGYELEADLGSAQTVSIQRSARSKFPEVLAQQHGSATMSGLRLYEYDGTRYRLTKCIDQHYVDPSDPERILDKPVIEETPCDPEELK